MTPQELISSLQAQGLKPRSYSGRGMSGAECIGVSVRHPNDYVLPPGWRHDTLGLGYIVYWRDVEWPEGVEEED